MKRFRVTYDVTTEESAENGDVAERGYAMPGGWRYQVTPGVPSQDDFGMSLREAIELAGGGFEDSGRWFDTMNDEIDYSTGERTGYSIHPPRNITPASYRRVARLLGCR